MLQLSEIYIYPIKSLGGIRLSQSEITTRGLKNDRRFMLIDENGRFLSQREFPQLAIFQATIEGDSLTISHQKNNPNITVPLTPNTDINPIITTVWDDEVSAVEVSSEANQWFSEALAIPTRLVYMPEQSERKVEPQYGLSGNEITSFSDGYPILIIGQSSLDDLNNRLAEPVNINRFRPNLVFTDGEPFEEDNWHEFLIDDVRFFGVKPCSRCIMTTIDQSTGEKVGKEPLQTLNKYRKAGNKILFGQNVLVSQLGTVCVGDKIEILNRRKLDKFEVI